MNEPSDRVFTLTYCSRNRIQGGPAEVREHLQAILTAARRNNPRLQITGALLYNAGSFAQILEGPLENVQRIFETIQRDSRHSEVTVIQSESDAGRQFPDWAMAFAGGSSFEGMPIASDAFQAVFSGAESAGEQMLSLLRTLMVDDSEWLLLDTAVPT